MEEMIEVCIPHMLQSNKDMTEDEARTMMNNFFPTLKRWK
ncbi:putative zinc ribbon domain protein [Clostridioides difficile DA00246]|nr:putative zinc ribbon domain protein [Clostridioides difficile DA00246]EQK71100.1 putative zinc ribbon domain protein [Clostridioides difficile CD90]